NVSSVKELQALANNAPQAAHSKPSEPETGQDTGESI
ncbi:hypothetical protein LCGC14_2451640, partial [marine sediment metagenome]